LKEKAVPLPGGLFICVGMSLFVIWNYDHAENFAVRVVFLASASMGIPFFEPTFQFFISVPQVPLF